MYKWLHKNVVHEQSLIDKDMHMLLLLDIGIPEGTNPDTLEVKGVSVRHHHISFDVSGARNK